MPEQTEHEAIAAAETWLRPPDEPPVNARSAVNRCDQCGGSDVCHDERIHETFVYCRDCGAVF